VKTIILILFLSATSHAQTIEILKIYKKHAGVSFKDVKLKKGDQINEDIRVVKVKRNKAVIKINDPDKYYVGQIIKVDSEESGDSSKWYIDLLVSFESGGDTVVTTSGEGGGVGAGDGMHISAGLRYDFNIKSHAQLNIGFKNGGETFSNGKLDQSSMPIEFLGYYHDKKRNYRIGAGLAYHMNNQISIESDGAATSDLELDPAIGFIFAGDYFFGKRRNIFVGLKFTSIGYETKPIVLPGSLEVKNELDASNIGIVLGYMHGF